MDPQDEKSIERAIRLAAATIRQEDGKEKPVLLHSVRVGVYLQNQGYSAVEVAAAFLHDVLENSDTAPARIEEELGPEVTKLVRANTHDDSITGKTEQYKEMFARCKKAGTEALAIKAADLLDNTRYYEQADEGKRRLQLEKIRYFLDLSARSLGDHAVWQELRARYFTLAGKG